MEEDILTLLQSNPENAYSAKQISRIVDRDQFREDPNWARPVLEDMVRRRYIVADSAGYYFRSPSHERAAAFA